MSAGSNFFICSCAVVIFTIINLSLGPIINYKVGFQWGLANCEKLEDDYEESQKYPMTEKERDAAELGISRCKNEKGMYNMEYTSFIFNTASGFICVLLGLYGLQKEVIPKTGLIGMVCGIAGFILTFIYVIYNGIVYTNYYDDNNDLYKTDSDGAFAELVGTNVYECFYHNKPNDTEALRAKYCDLIKSQYNYNKELADSFKDNPEKQYCQPSPKICEESQRIYDRDDVYYKRYIYVDGENIKPCSKLYYRQTSSDYSNYDLSARFLTTLILSIIILLCYCGLVFSSFLLSKETT